MYGVDGRRWLDFSSQLMGVNIGHGDKRVTEAIARQAEKLPYISPFQAFEGRAVLGKRLAGLWPGDIEKTFFTLAGAEANENAVKIAKLFTGRQKVLARYRSYHGSTYGDDVADRRPAALAERAAADAGRRARARPLPRPAAWVRRRRDRARAARGDDRARGAGDDRRVHPRDRRPARTASSIPPDGYLQGVRELCTRFGILMIADEVMCGWGRTGEWFAVDHWHVVPDLITTAKGLTSSYAPLGAVGLAPADRRVLRRATCSGAGSPTTRIRSASPPRSPRSTCSRTTTWSGNAKRLDPVMRAHHEELAAKHPSVGRTRNIGLFGIIELVKNRETMEPLSPFNPMNETMQPLNRSCSTTGSRRSSGGGT